MEYRQLPHGTERLSVLGLGMGNINTLPDDQLEALLRRAIENGVNFFDLCAGGRNVYAPFGRAIRARRSELYFEMHFGAVYNARGEYAWSRDADEIRRTAEWELETIGTDYADFGFLHCVDEPEDLAALERGGTLALMQAWQKDGRLHHLGFSTHTPAMANRLLDTGLMDLMLFSVNPAYDIEQGDEWGLGTQLERRNLMERCQREGVGITVMKPFFGGKLLNARESPFGAALTHAQCLQYVLDRPGVLSAVPGVQTPAQLEELLAAVNAPAAEKDYSQIADFTADRLQGICVYCSHCQPCPAGIDVATVNKYYDLALVGDQLAKQHYDKLAVQADACLHCGHCDRRCPFHVQQSARMDEIAAYFG